MESLEAQLDDRKFIEKKLLQGQITPCEESSTEYPHGIRLCLIFAALLLSIFLVALDVTIIATAVPRITDEFHSLDQIGWYGSAFFLCLACFQSPWGKAYKYFSPKKCFLLSVVVFEFGSLLCALATNSTMFITGRAITGAGGAGITGGCYIITAYILPPKKVPAHLGLMGAVFSIASVAGPLLGGVLTDRLTWRWCFYINLPIGGAALVLIFFFYTPAKANPVQLTWFEKLLQFDLPGLCAILTAFICYLLAMEWGGITKAWNSPDVIGLLIGWIGLSALFVVIQWLQGERALVVPRIIKQRNITACCAFSACLCATNSVLIYFLPIYFQAIDNVSATESGIRNLPLILATSFAVMLGSYLIGVLGRFKVFFLVSAMVTTVGTGLLLRLNIGSSAGQYIGYQTLIGFGLGFGFQAPVIAAQALSADADIPSTTSIVLFFQMSGGALAVSAAQSIFTNRLLAGLPVYAPELDPAQVLAVGATGLRAFFPPAEIMGILQSYMAGLRAAWGFGVGLAGCMVVASLLPEMKSIRKN